MSQDALGLEEAREILDEHGWKPTVDDDGDLAFRNQGFNHFLIPPPDDDCFWVIIITDLFRIGSIFQRDVALDEVNRLNRQYKLGKACLVGDPEMALVEMEFLASGHDSLERSIARGCDLLPMMAGDFRRSFRSRVKALDDAGAD